MRKLALLLLIGVSACTTVNKWTDNTMAWADRTLPTYDELMGKKPEPQQVTQNYTQRTPVPTVPVETENTMQTPAPMSNEQEVYYDNSERGYSFGK